MADKLQGTWVFDKVLFTTTSGNITYKAWQFNFISNGETFVGIYMGSADFSTASTCLLEYLYSSGGLTIYNPSQTYRKEYLTIEILSTYDEVENADTLLQMLQARATHTATAEQINVPMTSAKGVLLKTEGKLCEKNIVVTPEVEELVVTENGEYTPSKVGYSKVTVEVAASGGEVDPIEGYFDGSVTDLVLPNVVSIKSRAFREDNTIVGVSMPKVTSLGSYAFYNCTALTSVSMPKVTSLGSYAFYSCSKLALTSLPSTLTKINSNAFYSCTNLALTELPSGLTSIDSNGFYGCSKLALTSLPSGITTLGESAFNQCTNLALTSLPNGITKINNTTFGNCKNLALTELPSGLTYIDMSAFNNCTNIAISEIPSGVTYIGSYAFYNCKGITTLTFKSMPTKMYSDAFKNCTNLTTINVPWAEGAVASAPWGATNATINYNYTGG